MKKARMLAGVAGLTPAVAGMALPAAAHASAAASGQAGNPARTAKTVSLHPIGMSRHSAAPAVSSVSSPTSLTGGCRGSKYTGHITSKHATMWYWWAPNTRFSDCIGNVWGEIPTSRVIPQFSPYLRVRIYGNGHKDYSSINLWHSLGANDFFGRQGVHADFPRPVEVCAAWLSQAGFVIAGPVCNTT